MRSPPQRSSSRDPGQGFDLGWAPPPRQAREEAETRKIELEAEKIAGEIAQQPQEAREREVRIQEGEARTARIWLLTLLPWLLLAIGFIAGSVDSGSLARSGYELLGGRAWLLP